MKTETPDQIERLVAAAIDAVQKGDRAGIEAAFEALAPLETGDVIAELFLLIDELSAGVHQPALLRAVELPVPPRAEKILAAARRTSLPQLMIAVRSVRLEKAIASLTVLVAALKDARTRI